MIRKRNGANEDISPATHFAASKAVAQMAFVDRSYGLNVLPPKHNLRHDLAVMLHYGDLSDLWLDLIGHDDRILFTFTVRFHNQKDGGDIVDSARGVELPMIDRRLIGRGRYVVRRNGGESAYRHLLRMNWSPIAPLQRCASDSYESEHARKITGGRQSGSFQLGRTFRNSLVVTSVPRPNYAFARIVDADLKQDVFCHCKFAAPGCGFAVGRRITAVVVQTPRGLQARAIRANWDPGLPD